MVTKEHLPISCLYRPAEFYMLRTAALPAETFFQLTTLPVNCDSSQNSTDIEAFRAESIMQCYQELQSLFAQGNIEQAVAIASISLVDELQRVHPRGNSRKTERAYSRLLRYLVRMCTRPTPFGLFAGIAMGTFADHSEVQLITPIIHRIRTRPDMGWLLQIIKQVEQVHQMVVQLNVTTNPISQVRGGRIFLPSANIYGQSDTRNPSLRATPPVLYALENARQPICYTDLHYKLITSFPKATEEQVDQLLWQLWTNHFLLSDLLPPLAHKTPACYILDRLRSVQGAESTADILQSVLAEVKTLDQANFGSLVPLLRNLARQQEQLLPEGSEQPQSVQLQIDAALSVGSAHLNQEIGAIAAQAADVLLRLGRFSHGLPHLQQYLVAFLERYGQDQEVPVLDLLSPEKGLDAPPTYENPPRTYPLFPRSFDAQYQKLDTALCALVTEAVNDRRIEIELTDDVMQQIEQWSPKLEEAPFSLDIYLQVLAQSQAALDRGEWKAVIGPNFGAPSGGRSFGRFFDLFDEQGRGALQQFIQREEALAPDKIFAEISYLPINAHVANVITQPGLRAYEIVVGTTPSVPFERVIQLDELVVGVRNNRFYVRSVRLGKDVLASQSHMLNPQLAPNVCRFLLEVTQTSTVCPTHFNWGLAYDFPFLPRLVRGKVILRPAQWRLNISTIISIGDGSNDTRWFVGLQQWRARWRVPRYVYLTSADNRLLLDLEHPLFARELQAELAKASAGSTIVLTELLPDLEHLWLQDNNGARYFSEIVVPLIRADAPNVEPKKNPLKTHVRTISRSQIISQVERSAFPGDAWIYFKLYCTNQQQNTLIAGPLRDIVQGLLHRKLIDQWFYVRYCDSEPHLRIRFHISPSRSNYGVLSEVLDWARQIAEHEQINRFSIDTYEREIERYGGSSAINVIEQFFTVDSMVVSNLVAAHYNRQITIDALDLAVFSLDTLLAGWGLDLTERLRWLQQNTQRYAAGKEFHKKQKRLCDLLVPWEHTHDSALMRERALLCQLVAPLQSVLPIVSGQIYEIDRAGDLGKPVEHILGSLVHMHVNRLLEIDRQREQHVYALWRQTVESLHLRPKQ